MRAPAAARFAAVFVPLVASIACGAAPTEPTPPPAPVYELKTSTFTGKVTTSGSAGFPVHGRGSRRHQPLDYRAGAGRRAYDGLAVGSWDAAASTCTQQLSTNTATVDSCVFAANPSAPGEYCGSACSTSEMCRSAAISLSRSRTY